MEYLIVLGFVAFIVGIIAVVSSWYSQGIKDTVNVNQVDAISKEIVDNAESIYYFGKPSRTKIRVYVPKGITEITIPINVLVVG